MIETKIEDTRCLTFHLSEMREELQKPAHKKTTGAISQGNAHECFSGIDWQGTRTWAEALKLATQGDQDTLLAIEKTASKIQLSGNPTNNTVSMLADVSGGCVDVEKYLLGEPLCMTDFVLRQDKSKIIRILVSVGFLAEVLASDMRLRGKAIFEIVRALELSGYSVELSSAARAVGRKGEELQLEIVLKHAGEYLDPAIAAFYLCNPASHRRINFKLREIYSPEIVCGGSYGSTRDLVLDAERLQNTVVLQPKELYAHVAQESFTRQLKTMGVDVDLAF